MHSSALINLDQFFSTYFKKFENPKILDFGSQSLADHKSAKTILETKFSKFSYVGADIAKGQNVDVVLKDPYNIKELDSNSFDIIVCTSTFEHIEFFWLTYLEIIRVLKPRGIFYLNAPSNGDFHRWNKDCWRFYPDSGNALINWAKKNNLNPLQLEAYTSKQILENGWNDYISIVLKDSKFLDEFNDRIIFNYNNFFNGIDQDGKIYNFSNKTEDHKNWGYRLWYKLRKKIDKIKWKKNY